MNSQILDSLGLRFLYFVAPSLWTNNNKILTVAVANRKRVIQATIILIRILATKTLSFRKTVPKLTKLSSVVLFCISVVVRSWCFITINDHFLLSARHHLNCYLYIYFTSVFNYFRSHSEISECKEELCQTEGKYCYEFRINLNNYLIWSTVHVFWFAKY